MTDIGLTHIALPVANIQRSVTFYQKYANMEIVHQRVDPETGKEVVWISDQTRPFVVVLIESDSVNYPLRPPAHLGVGCRSQKEVDQLSRIAKEEGCLIKDPENTGPPVGYWAILKDPDGHTLEIAFGQEVGLTVASS